MVKGEIIDVAVVGAGASGLMAACAASEYAGNRKISVVLLERNDKPGRKLSLTGKGRCNITNNAEKEQFMLNIPGNGKFLFSALSRFSNRDIVAFFEQIGVGVTLERGGRYFAKSGVAREVSDSLARRVALNGATIRCGCRIVSVEKSPHCVTDIRGGALYPFLLKTAEGREIYSRTVIVATGGISYPATGSTGDGYGFAERFGHTVIAPRPSLVPLETCETWPGDLAGLTLKNVTLRLFTRDGKKVFSKLGEMLFTHFGISGPLVLSGSRALLECGFAGSEARIDLKPGLSDEKLQARINRDFALYSKKRLKNSMDDLLPSRLISVIIAEAGLDPETRTDCVGKAGIAKLSETMKGLKLKIKASRPASESIVTAGGVKTSEINPSSMESRLVPGLFFCGELIDVDAYTGGFNLTIAFSTGRLSGVSAARSALRV